MIIFFFVFKVIFPEGEQQNGTYIEAESKV